MLVSKEKGVLLCSDLDRTILPNGLQEESPEARQILRRISQKEELTLIYVSGRSESLLKAAIEEYDLPVPDLAIGDVGTTIYAPNQDWSSWTDWMEEIAPDWQGKTWKNLAEMFSDIDGIRLQEPEKQNTCKLSYYADPSEDYRPLVGEVKQHLKDRAIRASVIWSIDETENIGLLDILPQRATKLHAIRFAMKKLGFSEARTVFAGDSGNDLKALTSGLQAVLVKNATDHVRKEALAILTQRGIPKDRLYLAQGNFLGMNGNYSAGVLEGLAHFLPETRQWMEDDK